MSDFSIATRPQQADALVQAVAQREISEAQNRIILAQRFPRDEAAAAERIRIACQRPGLAEAAMYSYVRGGTNVTGPSIRLAEALAQNWRNFDSGTRELEQRIGESTIEAYAWDLESNVRVTKQFQVPHIRRANQRNIHLEDPRDIYEAVANQASRRMRACILALIPGDIVEMAIRTCEETLASSTDCSPAAVKKMFTAFETNFGVTREQIETRLGRKIGDEMSAGVMIGLIKIYNSLKDGMSRPADWFKPVEAEVAEEELGGTERVKEALKRQQTPASPPPVDDASDDWQPEVQQAVVPPKAPSPDLCPFHKLQWVQRSGPKGPFWTCPAPKKMGGPNMNEKGYCKSKPPEGYDGPVSHEDAPGEAEPEPTPIDQPAPPTPQGEAQAQENGASDGDGLSEEVAADTTGADPYAAMDDKKLTEIWVSALRRKFGAEGTAIWAWVEARRGKSVPHIPGTCVKGNREAAIADIRALEGEIHA